MPAPTRNLSERNDIYEAPTRATSEPRLFQSCYRLCLLSSAICHYICHYSSGLLGSHETKGNSVDNVKDAQTGVDKPINAISISWLFAFVRLPKPFVGRSSRLGGTIIINRLQVCAARCREFVCHTPVTVDRVRWVLAGQTVLLLLFLGMLDGEADLRLLCFRRCHQLADGVEDDPELGVVPLFQLGESAGEGFV